MKHAQRAVIVSSAGLAELAVCPFRARWLHISSKDSPCVWAFAIQLGIVILASSLLIPSAIYAQQNSIQSRSVVALIDATWGLPLEYRADIQLNIVESAQWQMVPRKLKMRLLEQLFHDAYNAKFPYHPGDVNRNQLANSQRLDMAMKSLNLDGLTIQARVIRAMLQLDPLRARERFGDIVIRLPSFDCQADTVSDVTSFYRTLVLIVGKLKPQETKAGVAEVLAEKYMGTIGSPLQLMPAADVILGANLSPDELDKLVASYTFALSHLTASDRELQFIEKNWGSARVISAIASRYGAGAPQTLGLLQAYRAFLVRSATGTSCSDVTTDRRHIAESFNQLLQRFSVGAVIPEIQVSDLKPLKTDGVAQAKIIPDASEISRGLTKRLVAYRAVAQRSSTPLNPLDYEGWDEDANELLKRIEEIDTSNVECPVCVFQEKAELFYALFDMSPPDATKERVLLRLVTFMSNDRSKQDNPIEWLYRFKLLLNLSRKPTRAQGKEINDLLNKRPQMSYLFLPGGYEDEIKRAIESQKDDLMIVYLKADRILENQYVMPPYK